jgi:hypothetical protein
MQSHQLPLSKIKSEVVVTLSNEERDKAAAGEY